MTRKKQSKSSSQIIRTLQSLLVFILFFLTLAAQAQDSSSAQSEQAEATGPTLEEKFIRSNISVSEWIDSVAEGLDLFLVGSPVTKKKNQSSVRIENTTFVRERQSANNSSSINVNLRLPNVEEYWQLKFTSYDEANERRATEVGATRKLPRERDYGATVGLFRKLGNVRASFQPRISLGNPVKISHSINFESVAELKNHYSINPKLEFFANPDDGTGIFTAFNFNVNLGKIFTLTFVNNFEYRDRPHYFSGTHGVSLGQAYDKRSSFSYDFITDSNNRESYHLDSYTLGFSYYHLVYKRILEYSMGPNWVFPRSDNFRPSPGFTFDLSLNF